MPAERQIENPIEEGQVVRIGAAHQRGRVDQFDPGDVGDPGLGQRHDLVAGPGGDAEDLGVVAEEAQVADRAEEGPVGEDLAAEGAGGPEALVLLVEGEELAAGGGVAGGPGEAVAGGGGGGEAGLRGRPEEEEEEGEGGDGDGGEGELVEERLDVPLHRSSVGMLRSWSGGASPLHLLHAHRDGGRDDDDDDATELFEEMRLHANPNF